MSSRDSLHATAEPAASTEIKTHVPCPECGYEMRRAERKGFLQRIVYSFFGYYPWQCPLCKGHFMLKRRRRRRSSSSHKHHSH